MRHFYIRAEMRKHTNDKPDLVDADFEKAANLAALLAPYRHAQLSAVKLAGDPNNPARIADDASIEELKALVMTHLERLTPVLDLKALMAPVDWIINRDMPQGGAVQWRWGAK